MRKKEDSAGRAHMRCLLDQRIEKYQGVKWTQQKRICQGFCRTPTWILPHIDLCIPFAIRIGHSQDSF